MRAQGTGKKHARAAHSMVQIPEDRTGLPLRMREGAYKWRVASGFVLGIPVDLATFIKRRDAASTQKALQVIRALTEEMLPIRAQCGSRWWLGN